MPALEAAAKGSAVGLGETADVANIVASVAERLLGFGPEGRGRDRHPRRRRREGRAEPEEFANALGRILPIASTVGVTFDQVAASMASLSNIGLDVNEATTAMRGVLQALAAPGKQAADALASLGLSAQDMLDAISERGIIGALRQLDAAAKQQTQTQAEYNGVMREIIPNVRALTGVFGLTVQEAEKVDAIFRRVLDSSGALGEAFKTTAESDAFLLQKAMNDLVVVGTQLGTSVLPTLANAMKLVADNVVLIATAFGAWLIVTRVVPALLTGIGNAALAAAVQFPKLSQGMLAVGNSAQVAKAGMAGLTGVLTAGLTLALIAIPALIDNFSISLEKLAKDTGLSAGFLSDLDTQLSITGRIADNVFTSLDLSFSGLISIMDGTRDQVEAVAEALVPLYGNLQSLGLSSISAENFLQTFTSQLTEATAPAIADMTEDIESVIETILAMGGSLDRGAIDLDIFTDKMVSLGFSIPEALALADTALDSVGKSVKRNGEIVKNWASLSDEEFAKFKEDVVESLQVTVGQFESFNDAFSTTPKELQKALNVAVRVARQELADIREILGADLSPQVEKALLGLEPAYRNAWARAGAAGKRQIQKDAVDLERATGQGAERAVAAIGKATPKAVKPPTLDVDARAAFNTIDGLRASLKAIPDEEVVIHAKTTGGSTAFDLIDHLTDALTEVTTTKWEVEIKALGTAEIDQLNAYKRDLISLGKEFDKLKAKADAFRDSIRSGFETFRDIGGSISGALDDFAQAQEQYGNDYAAFAKAQEEYAKELREFTWADLAAGKEVPTLEVQAPVAPIAPDIGAVIAQQVEGATAFAKILKRLERAGLSTANLQQIAAMGPAGQAVAEALLEDQSLIKQMNQATKDIADVTKQTATKLTDARFGEKLDRLGQDLSRLLGKLEHFLAHWDLPALNEKTKEFRQAVDRLANAMNRVSAGAGGGGGGKKAPWLQHGGTVEQSGLAVVHAGETVIPAGGGGGGITVNIYGDVTGEEVVTKVEQQLTQRLQRSGAIFNGAVRS